MDQKALNISLLSKSFSEKRVTSNGNVFHPVIGKTTSLAPVGSSFSVGRQQMQLQPQSVMSLNRQKPTPRFNPATAVPNNTNTNNNNKNNSNQSRPTANAVCQKIPSNSVDGQQANAQQYASLRRQDGTKLVATGPGGQQNTYTLIAYQASNPQTGGQSDELKKPQPTILYAIPANQAFLPQHLHQLQQAHMIQTSTGAMLVPSASLTRPNQMANTKSAATTSTTSTGCVGGPRWSGVDGGHSRPGELVCTCPPELHQALAEQQQRQHHHHQQQQLQNQHNLSILSRNNQLPDLSVTPSTSSVPAEEHKNQLKHTSTSEEGACNHQAFNPSTQIARPVSSPDCVICPGGPAGAVPPPSSCATNAQQPENNDAASSDAESHIGYLVALFQALKASGVSPESFRSAFRCLNFPTKSSDVRPGVPTYLLTELKQLRSGLDDLKHEHERIRTQIAQKVETCERQVLIQLKNYDRRKGWQQGQSFFDARIQRVRTDRQALDNALAAYQTTWSSLIGQLVDLEGVIEETGNDVLKGRCRITLQMVSALEERLHLASSAIEFCCENDPLLRKSIWHQADNERAAAEQETRSLEDQLEQLTELKDRSARLNGTIVTLKRLAKVNAHARYNVEQTQRLHKLGGLSNPSGSVERKRLMNTIRLLQPDHDERMRSMEIQEALRERRKRVFRDPPVFKGPAKALLLNGVNISPIWPADFEVRKSIQQSTEEESEIQQVKNEQNVPLEDSFDFGDVGEPITTANLPQPVRTPVILPAISSTHSTSTKMTASRLKNPNSVKGKRTTRVTFNKRVTLDDGSDDLPLNCILEDDEQEDLAEKKDFCKSGGIETSDITPQNCSPAKGIRVRGIPDLPNTEETPPAPPPRLSSKMATGQLSSISVQSTNQAKLLKYENMDRFLETLRNQDKSQKSQETW